MKKYKQAMNRLNELDEISTNRNLSSTEAKEYIDLRYYAIQVNRNLSLYLFCISLMILVIAKF